MATNERRATLQVPMVDLRVQYQELKAEILAAVEGVLDGMQLFLGPTCAP